MSEINETPKIVTAEIVPVAFELPPDQNPAAVYLATLRPSGRRAMLHALNIVAKMLSNEQHLAATFPWHTLRYQHTAALRVALQEKYRAPQANMCIKALRRVLQEAWRLGLVSAEDYRRAADIKAIRAETIPKGRALATGELGELLEICARDKSPTGYRDAALISILYSAGLRRSEAVALDYADYDAERGSITVRSGKGNKDRRAFLEESAQASLEEWLEFREDQPGPLFYPINKADKIMNRRLTDQAVLWILQKRAREAGVKSFSPHDLRRTFITDLLDAGVDIATVQKMAGHASVTTTSRYDRRGEETQRQAVRKLKMPGKATGPKTDK